MTSIQNACAGFFAAFFSSLTLCPTELIKCKLQAVREVQMETKSVLTVAKVTEIKKLICKIYRRIYVLRKIILFREKLVHGD